MRARFQYPRARGPRGSTTAPVMVRGGSLSNADVAEGRVHPFARFPGTEVARCPSVYPGRPGPVGAENPVTSCDLHVLVYEAAEPVSSQRPDGRCRRAGECGLRAGADRAIGAGGGCCNARRTPAAPRARWRGPVIRRWSRHSRRSVPMKRSAIAFARGARTGVRMMRMSAPANTASKAAVNLLSRSRIKNRNWSARSPRSMSRLRACWVTQAPVGWAVIPAMCTRRVPCSITTRT